MTHEIILVGTYHFAAEIDAVRDKSGEIETLVDELAKWRPEKIAVEVEKSEQENLQSKYQQLEKSLELDEVEQIAFQLGRKLDHQLLHAVDVTEEITAGDLADLQQAISEHYPAIYTQMKQVMSSVPDLAEQESILSTFTALNNPELIKKMERLYLSFSEVENGIRDIGLAFTKKWAAREFGIFKNVISLAGKKQERILLLVGSDHLWMLNRLFSGIGWRVINPFHEN